MTKKEDRESQKMSEATVDIPNVSHVSTEDRVLQLEEVVGNLVREVAALKSAVAGEAKAEAGEARARLFPGIALTETPRRRVAAK